MPLTTATMIITEPLPLATLQVEGTDAAAFLHAMLTQDILQLAAGQATRAGFCNAKGRLLADLLVTRRTETSGYHLTLHDSLADEIQRTLQRFVLRQKVRILRTDEQHSGLIHPDETTRATRNLPPVDPLHGGYDQQGAYALWVHTGTTPRLLLFQAGTAAPAGAPADSWHTAEILDGLPQITAQTTGHFVPQWLNLDRLGAISFKKGCYPGQEVIARLHYLGKPNRQLVLGQIDGAAPLLPGTATTPQEDPSIEAGTLVRSAPDPINPQGQIFLAVLRSAHLHDALAIDNQPVRISPQPVNEAAATPTTH